MEAGYQIVQGEGIMKNRISNSIRMSAVAGSIVFILVLVSCAPMMNGIFGLDKDSSGSDDNETIVASGICGPDAAWTLSDKGTLTISGSGSMTDYSEPYGYGIVLAPWYSYRASIKKIAVSSGITATGDYAFYDCTEAVSVLLASSVTAIGNGSFEGSGITAANLSYVTSIGEDAFEDCDSLGSVTLSANLREIGEYAFSYLSVLTSLKIPLGVTTIDDGAFAESTAISSITIPASVTAMGSCVFEDWTNSQTIIIKGSTSGWDSEWNSDCTASIYYE
jgi:hypothetical protein